MYRPEEDETFTCTLRAGAAQNKRNKGYSENASLKFLKTFVSQLLKGVIVKLRVGARILVIDSYGVISDLVLPSKRPHSAKHSSFMVNSFKQFHFIT